MAEATYTIRLDSLEVTMGLGIHPDELAAPQRVLVSVAMPCAYPSPPDDRIDAVVDYARMRAGSRAIALSGHFWRLPAWRYPISSRCPAFPGVVAGRGRPHCTS